VKIVNVIGAGLIGQERFKAVKKLQARGFPVRLGHVYDPLHGGLAELAAQYGFAVERDLAAFHARPADLVAIACPHDVATEHACTALAAGRNVLIEKPMGRNREEVSRIAAAAAGGPKLFIGLNYRFMPGIAALLNDWRSGMFGRPVSVQFQIGHGGRPGDEKTWKLDPVRCGGGALLDPGIHLLDLSRQFFGETPAIEAALGWQGFWKTGIEEDVHLLLRHAGVVVSMDISVVRWRSSFDIFALGTDGYGHVSGRGRSYGPQRYTRGRRWGWLKDSTQAASEELVVEDPCEDSFTDELSACLGLGAESSGRAGTLADGIAVMEFYHDVRTRLSV